MPKSCKEIWATVLEGIQHQVSPPTFNLWFRNTELISLGDPGCEIGVPNSYTALWLQRNFLPLIKELLSSSLGRSVEIGFSIHAEKTPPPEDKQPAAEARSEAKENRCPTPLAPPQKVFQLSDFVVGPSNQLAYIAALEIAKSPRPPFNTLFIYGQVGLGKTHILQGIWNCLRENRPKGTIYMPAEHWTNEFISSLQKGRVEDFRKRYRNAEVLLIDDVHFLSDKRGIQEEFLHTFNALYHGSKRIVLASDAHPRDIRRLKESLSSRMMSGMVAEIRAPDFTTSLGILKYKAQEIGRALSEEVFQYMADRLKNKSVRELESTLTAVMAHAATYKKEIDVNLVKEILSGIFAHRQRVMSLEDIEKGVSRYFQLSPSQLRSTRKNRSIILPRHLCCYLAKTLTDCSYKEIGDYFGNRRHTTCLSAMNKIKRRLQSDSKFRELVDGLIEDINRRPQERPWAQTS